MILAGLEFKTVEQRHGGWSWELRAHIFNQSRKQTLGTEMVQVFKLSKSTFRDII